MVSVYILALLAAGSFLAGIHQAHGSPTAYASPSLHVAQSQILSVSSVKYGREGPLLERRIALPLRMEFA